MSRAHGIDFSKWALDWIKPENANIDFAIQRVSWGLHTDERYENHSQRMNQVDCRMAYHFYSSAVPWKKQVDFFLDKVNNNPYTNYQAIWWDYEQINNVLSKRTTHEAAEAIRYLRMGFEGRVGIYTNRNDYTVHLAPYIDRIWLDDVPYWIACPTKKDPQIAEPPWGFWRGVRWVKLPRKEGKWDLWQYSWNGNPAELGIIGKKQVDVDVYNGTVEDLKAWLDVGGEEPPEPLCREKEILNDLRGVLHKYE